MDHILYFRPVMNHDAQAHTSLIKLKIIVTNERENKKMHKISTGLDKINCLAQ